MCVLSCLELSSHECILLYDGLEAFCSNEWIKKTFQTFTSNNMYLQYNLHLIRTSHNTLLFHCWRCFLFNACFSCSSAQSLFMKIKEYQCGSIQSVLASLLYIHLGITFALDALISHLTLLSEIPWHSCYCIIIYGVVHNIFILLTLPLSLYIFFSFWMFLVYFVIYLFIYLHYT